jgi:hypothetical protein
MPFDGTAASPSTRAVLMLDYLAEFFADGRNWYQGAYRGPDGSACLVQAMNDIRRRHKLQGEYASVFIRRALGESTQFRGLIAFNDWSAGYDDIRRILCRARDLAAAERRYTDGSFARLSLRNPRCRTIRDERQSGFEL